MTSINLWFRKYKPNKFTELLFSNDTHFLALKWLKNFQKGNILNINGGYGYGKTSLVYCIAKTLKYNVVEISDIKIENLKHLNNKSSLNKNPTLLLIDECEIINYGWLNIFKKVEIPIIITTTSMYLKNYTTLKMIRPSTEMILNYVNSVLQKENLIICQKLILRLAEVCNYDFRSVLNYAQLFSKCKFKLDLKIVERISSSNIFKTCSSILGERMKFSDFENNYSSNIADLCFNSILANSNKTDDILKLFTEYSEIITLPEKYNFIICERFNNIRCKFTYIKSEQLNDFNKNKESLNDEEVINKNTKINNYCNHFLPFYRRDFRNVEKVEHLQNILRKYKNENMTDEDIEIMNIKSFKEPIAKVFKYKYNFGSSCAAKRDTTIDEILNI